MPLAATVRPPRNGPIIRQRISENSDSGSGCALAETARSSGTERDRSRDPRRRNGLTDTSVGFESVIGPAAILASRGIPHDHRALPDQVRRDDQDDDRGAAEE